MQHAMRMRHIIICGLPRSTVFFNFISQTAGFSKKVTEKNFFNFLYKIFLKHSSFQE